jgi:hypothetical protein
VMTVVGTATDRGYGDGPDSAAVLDADRPTGHTGSFSTYSASIRSDGAPKCAVGAIEAGKPLRVNNHLHLSPLRAALESARSIGSTIGHDDRVSAA